MLKMSDLVANYILKMLEEQDGKAEIQRNTLANNLGCVPSQINYVITSRFTPENGYMVESRRGGGGCIKIIKVTVPADDAIMAIITSIGQTIDKQSIESLLNSMISRSLITIDTAKIIASAMSDKSLARIAQNDRGAIRADIFKNILITLI